ncbi:acyltransferase [Helicobacter aurati]|uniref:acyltransferase n=1 Tax=Helicobacter aurati TaxID=137778 RepID=UPI000CF183BA|nr:transferase [Helicobacter aurati]
MSSFYSREELLHLGLQEYGENVLISRKASLYNVSDIRIGSHVRIDDFVILSGKITIHNFVHIGAFSVLIGGNEGIEIQDFTGVSLGCKILSSSDDFSGNTLSNPMIPKEFKNVQSVKITLQKHALLGSGSVVLPNSGGLAQGVSVGALSLVTRPTKPFGIYFGNPAKRILEREKNLLVLEKQFLAKLDSINLTQDTINTRVANNLRGGGGND